MEKIQTVVVGAGVVGIAIARALAQNGHEVLILEEEDRVGQHTSSHNSGVIHAGIYYPKGSLRARLCVRGKEMLYAYCARHHIPFEKTGKLIVATDAAQLSQMDALVATAAGNGVDDLYRITATEAAAREPSLHCLGAIVSPSTGIVDASALVSSLLGGAESAGAMLALASPLVRGSVVADGYILDIADAARTRLKCKNLVNAAGLGAWDVARNLKGFSQALVPMQNMAKGNWYTVPGPAPFQSLIYPMPDAESLGVHYVRDTGGGFRFGPDIRYLERQEIDYRLDGDQAAAFRTSVRRWWPDLPERAMQPESCGIRPRITARGAPQLDFQIVGPKQHKLPGLVHLFGIESPGLTSCLAIGDHVTAALVENEY